MKHPGFCVSNLWLALCLAGNARGADVSAQAALCEAQTSVRQPGELQITISGAQKALREGLQKTLRNTRQW